MRVLSRALRTTEDVLPMPWWTLPIQPRPGYMVLGLGAPGAGKSTFGLRWAVHLAEMGRPVLLLSMDTDLRSQALRAVAMLKNLTVVEVEKEAEAYADWLHESSLPIRWSETSITSEDLKELLQAEVEYLGEPPALVVVDVVEDLLPGEQSPEAFHVAFNAMKRTARTFKTTVLALHHIKRGEAADGDKPVRKSDGVYGGERRPEIVLGMWRPRQDVMRVGVLKNRMGQDGTEVDLNADMARASITSKAFGR